MSKVIVLPPRKIVMKPSWNQGYITVPKAVAKKYSGKYAVVKLYIIEEYEDQKETGDQETKK